MFNRKFVNIIGTGVAGIECALFLANHGIKVHVFDCGEDFARDVYYPCDNPIKEGTTKLLIKELQRMGSPLICEGTLKGMREEEILALGKEMLASHENVKMFSACVRELNPSEVTVIATGNAQGGISEFLIEHLGGMLCSTYIPLYPIFDISANDLPQRQNYKLLGLEYDEYITFINSVIDEVRLNNLAKKDLKGATIEKLVFDSKNALRDFALRPVISDENARPYATIKFVEHDRGLLGVGLASDLPRQSQERMFKKINFLSNASLVLPAREIKVCQISSPFVVNKFHQALTWENLFFAGEILGISGYVDHIASGLYTALSVYKYFQEKRFVPFPKLTAIGKMAEVIASEEKTCGGFLEDYHIFSKEDIKDSQMVDLLAGRSMIELAKFKEEYNGKHV